MYTDFFGLECEPFENTNNSNFFYPNSAHREALASLLYSIKSAKGIGLLTGEVGSGKTQIIQLLKEMVRKDRSNFVCEVSDPKLTANELIKWLISKTDLNQTQEGQGSNELLEVFNNYLISKATENPDYRFVIIFDEAQLLSQEILEKVRLLSNFEFNFKKLVQIVLIGQPELKSRLEQYVNRPLMQRISIHKALSYFDEENTLNYIRFRLDKASCEKSPFSIEALKEIYLVTKGSPRLINLLCDKCLFNGFSQEKNHLNRSHVLEVMTDMPAGLFKDSSVFEQLEKQLEETDFNQVDQHLISHERLKTVQDENEKNKEALIIKEKRLKETTKTLSKESEESFEFPLPSPNIQTNHQPWHEPLWVKLLAGFFALFIVLWLYDFVRSFFLDNTDNQSTSYSEQNTNSQKNNQSNNRLQQNSDQPSRYKKAVNKPKTYARQPADVMLMNNPTNYQNNPNDRSQTGNKTGINEPNDSLKSRQSEVIIDSYHRISFPLSAKQSMFDIVTVQQDSSVSQLAYAFYGIWNTSIEDIIRQANPDLQILSQVSVGYQLKMPQLTRYSIQTQTNDGDIYVYFATFGNELDALVKANQLMGKKVSVTIQNSISQKKAITRIYLGPFASSKESNSAVENISLNLLGLN